MARAGLQEVVRTDRPFSLHLEGKKLPQASAAAIYLAGLPETADRGAGSEPRGATEAPSAAG